MFLSLVMLLSLFPSCKDDDNDDKPKGKTITIDPAVQYQEMVGFGGSLTWYSNLITASSKKNEICQLLFEDMGTDMVRFKNWYYPLGYPENKSPSEMETSGQKQLFETTNQLYTLAKQYNPGILTLLSSWSPPPALKSNGKLNEGWLKFDGDKFMYEAFADYWTDILDHITFSPDYISIQNEPSWSTPNWETCIWRPHEMDGLPSYEIAFDMVYDSIKARVNAPLLIGPEAENIGTSSFGGNTFAAFADVLKDKPSLAIYGFHTYNFNANTPISDTKALLNMIRDGYGNKPCMMTEYSNFDWLKTAHFIIQVLNEANASGYLYWDMVWLDTKEIAMIRISNTGEYTITPFYYVMKHFAKYIDAGYTRIDAAINTSSLVFSAFINPADDRVTLVIVNPIEYNIDVSFEVKNRSVTGITAVQTMEGSMYRDLGTISASRPLTIKPLSITTVVMDIE